MEVFYHFIESTIVVWFSWRLWPCWYLVNGNFITLLFQILNNIVKFFSSFVRQLVIVNLDFERWVSFHQLSILVNKITHNINFFSNIKCREQIILIHYKFISFISFILFEFSFYFSFITFSTCGGRTSKVDVGLLKCDVFHPVTFSVILVSSSRSINIFGKTWWVSNSLCLHQSSFFFQKSSLSFIS